MQDLWGEELLLQHKPKRSVGETKPLRPPSTAHDCLFYGHAWEYFGITGLKKCTVCGEKGYCPLCTPTPPVRDARPFYCTKHTPPQGESTVKV